VNIKVMLKRNTITKKAPSSPKIFAISILTLIVLAFVFLQVWTTLQYVRRSESVLQELENLKTSSLTDEKTRQETIALRIENERKSLFLTSFITNVGAALGIIVTLSGAWIGFNQYLNVRQRERLDRAAIDLEGLWQGITDENNLKRAGSIAGLWHFLSADKQEYHPRIASALALAGRLDNSQIVTRTLTPNIEYAMRHVDTESLRNISWQGLELYKADLSGLDLSGFDFRDSKLEDTDFRGSNLSGARFNAAILNGSKFDGANLSGANLEYADLAGASLKEANLRSAILHHIKVLNTDITRAKLEGTHFVWERINWELFKNWRDAFIEPRIRERLLETYGPPASGPRVLMLMWEFPPFVSGGGWTAAYHLVKNLRKLGADIVIMVPWSASKVSPFVFGNEVELIPIGSTPEADLSAYSAYSAYDETSGRSLSQYSSSYGRVMARRRLINHVSEFTRNSVETACDQHVRFDVIHAHDWLTFKAAESIANLSKTPWVAHFHSIEADRRKDTPDRSVVNIERESCRSAGSIVVPSNLTKRRLVNMYDADEHKITVAPNCLSSGRSFTYMTGDFGNSRVLFVGRLSWQKGPDIFVNIALRVRGVMPQSQFTMFGRGDEEKKLAALIEQLTPQNPIKIRGVGKGNYNYYYYQRIERIERINFSAEDHRIERLSELTPVNLEEVETILFERGFTAVPVQLEDPYNYRVTLNERRDDFHLHYLIKTDYLSQYRTRPDTFISLKGFVNWEDRDLAFDGATVLVVPSRHEPFGMVILEAMQYGVPVVFSKNAGVAEVIRSGITFDSEDVDDAAQKILDLLSDRSRWQEVVETQLEEISQYPARGLEGVILEIWRKAAGTKGTNETQRI